MMKRFEAIVRGKVQGVYFRHYTMLTATRLNVVGTVRNLADGSVLVRAEGDPEALQALLQFLRTGPPAARVDSLDLTWQEASNEFSAFRVVQ